MLLTAGGGYGRSVSLVLTAMYIMKRDRPSADIHLFNPHMNQWLKMGELPESRMSCTCTVLPSGKLLVAGEGVVRVNAENCYPQSILQQLLLDHTLNQHTFDLCSFSDTLE